MTHRVIVLILCLGLGIAVGPIGCGSKPETKDDKRTECSFVLPQSKANIQDFVEYTGRTAAVNSVDVKARVTGFLLDPERLDLPEIGPGAVGFLASPAGQGPLLTVASLASRLPLFKEGDAVSKGQRLFLIDPKPYDAQFEQAKAQVGLYDAQVEVTTKTYDQAIELQKKNKDAITDLQLRTYEAQMKVAKAGLDAAKASLDIYRINKGYTTVTSPIDGVVGRRNQTPGNVILQDQTLLTTVVALEKMYVYFDMDAPTYAKFHQGKQEIGAKGSITLELPVSSSSATAQPSRISGEINFFNNQFNPATDTILVRGVFENPIKKEGGSRLRPGMFVRVKVSIGEPYKALVVPDRAILSKMGKKYVYVVDEGNRVKEIPVIIGPLQEQGLRVIKAGQLTGKHRVIVTRLLDIQPKQEIQPVPMEPSTGK